MSFLIYMIQGGDIAANLLDEARRATGLNQTQAQICLHLAGLFPSGRLARRALSPVELSRAMKSPGARVHNQLSLLLDSKLVRRVSVPRSHRATVDQRQRKYMLTIKGERATETFWTHMSESEKRLISLLGPEEMEPLFEGLRRLSCEIEASALVDAEALRTAVEHGEVTTYED